MMHKNDIKRILSGIKIKKSEKKIGMLEIVKAQIFRIYRIIKSHGSR